MNMGLPPTAMDKEGNDTDDLNLNQLGALDSLPGSISGSILPADDENDSAVKSFTGNGECVMWRAGNSLEGEVSQVDAFPAGGGYPVDEFPMEKMVTSYKTLPGGRTVKHVTGGDLALQKDIDLKLDKLGLLDGKRSLERRVSERLDSQINDQDELSGAINRSRRLSESSRDQATYLARNIRHIIRQSAHTDTQGRRIYRVEVLMGRFTRDVRHFVDGDEIVLCGSVPRGPKLYKETRVEFPKTVDMTQVLAHFNAGVYTIDVPYRELSPPSSAECATPTSLTSSSASDEHQRMSMTSEDTNSEDVFSDVDDRDSNSTEDSVHV